jgi:hypothetical protein
MRDFKKNHKYVIIAVFLALIVGVLSSFCENPKTELHKLKFREVPDSLKSWNKKLQISYIEPNKQYKYWQCKFIHDSDFKVDENGKQLQRGELIYFRGDSSKYKQLADDYCTFRLFPEKFHDPIYGFYIVAINDSDKVELIDSEKIETFIGTIDNLEEATFVTYLHGFNSFSCAETDSSYVFNADYSKGTALLQLQKKGGLRVIEWKGYVEDDSQYRTIE